MAKGASRGKRNVPMCASQAVLWYPDNRRFAHKAFPAGKNLYEAGPLSVRLPYSGLMRLNGSWRDHRTVTEKSLVLSSGLGYSDRDF